MKKEDFLQKVLALLCAVAVIALVGCQADSGGKAEGLSGFEPLGEIGKTFDQLREEHPDIEYQSVPIPDASGECLGQDGDSFFYFFFGTQDFPGLMDLGAEYSDKLKCAGIVSTVGQVFPGTTDELPLERFFSDHHISEYTYNQEEDPAQGWIEFSHEGYFVWIDTKTYEGAEVMDPNWTVLVIDEEIAGENYAIRDTYWKEYLESNLPK